MMVILFYHVAVDTNNTIMYTSQFLAFLGKPELFSVAQLTAQFTGKLAFYDCVKHPISTPFVHSSHSV